MAVSTALSSLWNKLNHKAKWDQSLINVARNNHRICWADRSLFGVNGFFVIVPWYLAVVQTPHKCRSAGKIPGAALFVGEIPAGRALGCSARVPSTADRTRAAGNVLQQVLKSLVRCCSFNDSDFMVLLGFFWIQNITAINSGKC